MPVDLDDLPGESQTLEYKSARGGPDIIANKLQQAASGFWNAGNGVFLAGVRDDGTLDEGMPTTIGRDPIDSWADKHLKKVIPPGKWKTHILRHPSHQEGRCVLAVEFFASNTRPHQAYDGCYYLRLGKHTAAAPHSVVHALFHVRESATPQIVVYFQRKKINRNITQLVIETRGDVEARNVCFSFSPVPSIWKDQANYLPINMPTVSRSRPLVLDYGIYGATHTASPEIDVIVEFEDVAGNHHTHKEKIGPLKGLLPWGLGDELEIEKLVKVQNKLVDATNSIVKQLSFLVPEQGGED